MSSSEDSSHVSSSESSEESEYEVEVEDVMFDTKTDTTKIEHGVVIDIPYSDEPLASKEWIEKYEEEEKEEAELFEGLRKRLTGECPTSEWCTCGICNVTLMQNPYECLCCFEIEGCVECLEREEVLMEVGEVPKCVTLHPGFRPICLEKWSLKIAANKLYTREKKRYSQKTTEEA